MHPLCSPAAYSWEYSTREGTPVKSEKSVSPLLAQLTALVIFGKCCLVFGNLHEADPGRRSLRGAGVRVGQAAKGQGPDDRGEPLHRLRNGEPVAQAPVAHRNPHLIRGLENLIHFPVAHRPVVSPWPFVRGRHLETAEDRIHDVDGRRADQNDEERGEDADEERKEELDRRLRGSFLCGLAPFLAELVRLNS